MTDEPALLFLVTTGWLGNGQEGVLVAARDEDAAMDAAAEALREHHDAELAKWSTTYRQAQPPQWAAEDHAEHIADLEARDRWRVERITLPYVGEFS